jgi:hypothetical protein
MWFAQMRRALEELNSPRSGNIEGAGSIPGSGKIPGSGNAQGAGLDTLSMGMSGDFEAAIAEGATIIRIGTALFGERPRANTTPPQQPV